VDVILPRGGRYLCESRLGTAPEIPFSGVAGPGWKQRGPGKCGPGVWGWNALGIRPSFEERRVPRVFLAPACWPTIWLWAEELSCLRWQPGGGGRPGKN